jgi:uncharacterized membrane protein YraQ (UPF0718 family)
VLPAAASIKRQGANRGATTAFLISTPESGVDSMAVTYALIDPVMTVARPMAALATAVTAGVVENLAGKEEKGQATIPDLSCPVDNCCDGLDCPPEIHRRHHTWLEKIRAGLSFTVRDLWGDLAGWFFVGLLLAGLIMALVPAEFLGRVLGGGLSSMLIMLVVGLPLYICATASTPIAAALILKGVSPGATLVFLLVGPATNVTSLTMVTAFLGKRATALYLVTLSVMAVLCGLALDQVYFWLGSALVAGPIREVGGLIAAWNPFPWSEAAVKAVTAGAIGVPESGLMSAWVKYLATAGLLLLSGPFLWRRLRSMLPGSSAPAASGCSCSQPTPAGADLFPMADQGLTHGPGHRCS